MIDLYYWPTPNGWKAAILLEELGVDYRMIPVNISKGDQFAPEFLAISPNNRIPAILDHDPPAAYGDGPLPVFESGAILFYLARKYGRFLPDDARSLKEVEEWVYWQVGNLGPMAGQLSHFRNYAPEDDAYARERYAGEYARCLAVLDRRLEGRDFLCGAYSIADMASWPWVLIAKPLGQDPAEFPNLAAWRSRVKDRPAVQRGVDLGKQHRRSDGPDEAERRLLFQQNAESLRARQG
jgi:GST-like protein